MGHKFVIRSNQGGVLINAEILGDGDFPGTLLVRARQVWSWEGALNVSAIALAGITGGRLSDYAEISIATGDIIQAVRMTAEAVAAVDAVAPQ